MAAQSRNGPQIPKRLLGSKGFRNCPQGHPIRRLDHREDRPNCARPCARRSSALVSSRHSAYPAPCLLYPGGLNRSTQHFILKRWSVAMERRFRRGFTATEKTELWDRWKRGESLKAIGRAFGKPSSSIYFLVAPHGGIRPAERRRSRLALTLGE